MSDYAADQYEDARKNGFTLLEFDWRSPLKLSIDWFNEVRALDLTKTLRNYKGAVLAIAGSDDDVVDPAVTEVILNSVSSAHKQQKIIDGADHTFDIFIEDKATYDSLVELTVNWFKDTL